MKIYLLTLNNTDETLVAKWLAWARPLFQSCHDYVLAPKHAEDIRDYGALMVCGVKYWLPGWLITPEMEPTILAFQRRPFPLIFIVGDYIRMLAPAIFEIPSISRPFSVQR